MAAPTWKSLIRFKDNQGNIQYGEPLDAGFSKATVFAGPDLFSLSKTSETIDVKEVSSHFKKNKLWELMLHSF